MIISRKRVASRPLLADSTTRNPSMMAPSTKELEAALVEGTCIVYSKNPDTTTVNKVRRHVEEELQLDEGFFANDEWKNKSKALIKEYVAKLLDGWTPEPKASAKRASNDTDAPNKRRRRASQSEISDDEEKVTKAKARKESKSSKSSRPATTKKRVRKSKVESDESDNAAEKDGSESSDVDQPSKSKPKLKTEDDSKSAAQKLDTTSQDEAQPPSKVEEQQEEEEEYSDVLDEAPKPKKSSKKKATKQEDALKTSKSSKSPHPKKSSAPTATTTAAEGSDEAEIKKLQTQLVKCGVRKLWHNELKPYGDDTRAKMRHLKKMLADIGMDGRFSEAKARDIKEMRELMADAEAAQQMDALWGMSGSRGRASRSKATKPVKGADSEASGDDDDAVSDGDAKGDGDGDGDEDDEGTSFAARRRRAQADLAFLGDESDSD